MVEEQSTNQNMESTNISDDEADETLSLCDYSFSSTTSNLATPMRRSLRSSSSTHHDQEEQYFEFCSASEEWSHSMVSDEYLPAADNNVVFCGKIITPSDEPTSRLINFPNLVASINKGVSTRNGKVPVASFRWDGSHNSNNRRNTIKKEEDRDQLRKVWRSGKVLRWTSLFMLGGIRSSWFQTDQMGLMRDIKSRQSRLSLSSSSKLFRLDSINGGGGDYNEEMMMIGGNGTLRESRRQQGQGLWGLLMKAITTSSGGQRHANSVVHTSIGCTCYCIPRLQKILNLDKYYW